MVEQRQTITTTTTTAAAATTTTTKFTQEQGIRSSTTTFNNNVKNATTSSTASTSTSGTTVKKSKNWALYCILIVSIFCGLAFNIQTRGIVLFYCTENNNNINANGITNTHNNNNYDLKNNYFDKDGILPSIILSRTKSTTIRDSTTTNNNTNNTNNINISMIINTTTNKNENDYNNYNNAKIFNDATTTITTATLTTATTTTTTTANKHSIVDNNNNNKNNNDWPGRPVENIGHPLVFKGTNFVSNSRQLLLETYFDEFLTIYKNRPDPINLCGIRFNHAYALFLSVKVLQPTTVIESGVNAGQSTYFIRQAASPTTKIIPIDPLDEPICGQKGRWMDTVNSEYYTGTKNFQDFDDIDWNSKIQNGEIDPDRTLVFIDDHLVFFDRFLTLLKYGFRHVVIEDNYKLRRGSTPSDKAGFTAKQLLARNDGDGDSIFFWNQLISYAEFPPLIAPIHVPYKFTGVDKSTRKKGGFLTLNDTNRDMVHPLLRPDVSTKDKELFVQIATTLNEDPEMSTYESYLQFMNYNSFAYMELLPLAPRLAERVHILPRRKKNRIKKKKKKQQLQQQNNNNGTPSDKKPETIIKRFQNNQTIV